MPEKVCPVWIGHLLANPVRRLVQNPKNILEPYVTNGMTVLDFGCAMGFFSLPLAHMVGSSGKVICVDVQEGMIKSLEKRIRKAGLSDRVETRVCQHNSLGMDDVKEEIDFALAFSVVHEVSDAAGLISAIRETLKPSGQFLVAEPWGHVSEEKFGMTVSVAEQNGFKVIDKPRIGRSQVVMLEK